MKNKATWGIVGALTAAGAVGIALQPGYKFAGANETRTFRSGASQAQAMASETNAAGKKRACDDLAQVLEVFLGINEVPRPDSCSDSSPLHTTPKATAKALVKEEPALDPKFVIATLPDPIHTHLALMFDRMSEVIQQAAQDESYSYEASWLPWDDKDETYLRLPDNDQASYRKELVEDQPGILVFRYNSPAKTSNDPLLPYRDGLIVLVVGEDPTKGIHTEQFTNALAWIDKLKGLNDRNRARTAILGPTFSGSFPSLSKLLAGGESGKYLRHVRGVISAPLAIHSGTANDGGSIMRFNQVSNSDLHLSELNIDFHGFLERDEVGLNRYCSYLREQSDDRFESRAIAVISEDETAYGASKGGADSENDQSENDQKGTNDSECLNHALWLYYPRDISALRAAYQTNSMFNTTAPQQSADAGRGSLPSDLADPGDQAHDTIRSYAGNQTPLSQEAYLLGLVNAMRVRHIHYVILRSTNPLDQLFLARYLRRAYPDARIVTDGADRLFERERGATGMRGTMSLSTYPLLEREREWIESNNPSSSQRLFNSDTSEGTYVALRLLLHSQALSENPSVDDPDGCTLPRDLRQFDAPKDPNAGSLPALPTGCRPGLPIPDYGMPSWMSKTCANPAGGSDCGAFRRPATWLTVLGRDGFWAIAAMNEHTMLSKRDERGSDHGNYSSEIPLRLKILLVGLAGFVGFHAWCCWKASFTAKPSFRTHFANPGEWRHTVVVFLGGWFAALLPLFVGWGCGAFDASSAGLSYPWLIRGVVVLTSMVALGASVANILRIEQLRSGSKEARQFATGRVDSRTLIASSCGGSALGLIIFFAAFVLPLQCALMPANRFFTYYRNMHVLSGVSPLVPLLALTLGMYAWFWHSLHGLALFGKDRCRLPAETDLQLPDPETKNILRMFSQERAADATEGGAKPLAPDVVAFGVILATTLIVIFLAISRRLPVRSLGVKYYAGIFFVYLIVCSSLMLAEAWQLLRTWAKLRELLMFLDRTPLRRTLAALRGFSWGSVWGMSGNVLDVRYKLLSRQLESLGHTVAALKARADGKAADAARCCIAARYCIAVLEKLKQAETINDSNRLTLAQDCLDALRQLRKSAKGSLRATLDTARDCIVAQRLGSIMADPSAMAGVQECISALEKFVSCESEKADTPEMDCIGALAETRQHGMEFAKWYARNYRECVKAEKDQGCDEGNLESLKVFQESTAEATATVLVRLLLPEWRTETNSLVLVEGPQSGYDDDDQNTAPPLSEKQYIRDAEEFVCLPYMGFVQNMLGRMRSIVMSILWLFVATAIAISTYPFDPRQGLSGTILALFVLLAAIIFHVYAQMHRDSTLSHITNTKPGELGSDFWLKLVSFGIAPLLGLLTTVFPGITDFVFSWLQPGLQSIK
ncbi:MAG TPA: hypothetical protein VK763_06145 [Terriglobales bacterium]|jgi:hypothetical protein|nr:hypothetical protein [Terriglobales bacterium]